MYQRWTCMRSCEVYCILSFIWAFENLLIYRYWFDHYYEILRGLLHSFIRLGFWKLVDISLLFWPLFLFYWWCVNIWVVTPSLNYLAKENSWRFGLCKGINYTTMDSGLTRASAATEPPLRNKLNYPVPKLDRDTIALQALSELRSLVLLSCGYLVSSME